jgi:hypothetical protein
VHPKEMKFITKYGDSVYRISQYSPSRDQEGEPWVSVMPSVALGEGGGHGLFANRNFLKGEIVGKYVGRILGTVDNKENQNYVNQLSNKNDKIIVIN